MGPHTMERVYWAWMNYVFVRGIVLWHSGIFEIFPRKSFAIEISITSTMLVSTCKRFLKPIKNEIVEIVMNDNNLLYSQKQRLSIHNSNLKAAHISAELGNIFSLLWCFWGEIQHFSENLSAEEKCRAVKTLENVMKIFVAFWLQL